METEIIMSDLYSCQNTLAWYIDDLNIVEEELNEVHEELAEVWEKFDEEYWYFKGVKEDFEINVGTETAKQYYIDYDLLEKIESEYERYKVMFEEEQG